MQSSITIQLVHDHAQFEDAVNLQKIYWGDDDAALVPSHMLASIANYGGHVHAAYDGDTMVGVLMGFLGASIQPESQDAAPDRLLIMSKRMVVLPEYRGHKIGERLKLAQRDYALQHRIPLVTWTFDPMLSRNAYLNIHKLAALGQDYAVNYFGEAAAHPTLSEDRLVVNWWVDDSLTHQRLNGETLWQSADAPILNPVTFRDGLPVPSEPTALPEENLLLLEIPSQFVALNNVDAGLGRAWRDHGRHYFLETLKAGYQAVDFLRRNDRTFYVLAKLENPPGFAS